MGRTILLVDDEAMITTTLATLIKFMLKYEVVAVNNPEAALKRMEETSFDMIISDFMMPEMNGLEFLTKAKEIAPESVKILLTGYADKENAIKSINEVGLYYYLEKPWDNQSLIKILQNGLEKKSLTDQLQQKVIELEKSNNEILRLYDLLKLDFQKEVDNVQNLIISLANVIEAKDSYTDGHTRRVGNISKALGENLGMSGEKLQTLEIAGIIHDIGKVAVNEVILNKPGKLTDEEYKEMQKHTVMGELICKPLNCLSECIDIIRHHHEKPNGKGYPDGLEGDAVSMEARIVAVADVFDALYSDRPYRKKMELSKVKEIMFEEGEKGSLDKALVEMLFELIENNRLEDM